MATNRGMSASCPPNMLHEDDGRTGLAVDAAGKCNLAVKLRCPCQNGADVTGCGERRAYGAPRHAISSSEGSIWIRSQVAAPHRSNNLMTGKKSISAGVPLTCCLTAPVVEKVLTPSFGEELQSRSLYIPGNRPEARRRERES
jgi:hypothetical protein